MPPNTAQVLSKKNLEKRAKAKYITDIISYPLANLRSPLAKQYKLSQTCAGELTEAPGKVTGKYCGCRWCLVCSRIRTSRLITGYMPAIEAMPEKWFLTLSRPNVSARSLKAEIKHYIKCSQLINRHLREKTHFKKRKGIITPTFSALRKIECTFNDQTNTYHPHFHFVFDNYEAAKITLDQWLLRNPKAKMGKGNLLQKADNDSAMELFKYFTKVVSKSKSGKPGDYKIYLTALDTMFVAMRSVHTFRACGLIKEVSEEVEPEQSELTGREEINFWEWVGNDWINKETAELLTGYAPSDSVRDIANHVVLSGTLADNSPKLGPLPGATDFGTAAEHSAMEEVYQAAQDEKKRANLPASPPAPKHYQSTLWPGLAEAFQLVNQRTPKVPPASSPPA